jgi:hypothetical protein
MTAAAGTIPSATTQTAIATGRRYRRHVAGRRRRDDVIAASPE